jgi:hypothetical protein
MKESGAASKLFSFPSDDTNFTIKDLPKISAVIQEPFKPPKHCKIQDLMDVFFTQPWLAEEGLKDLRVEEEIMNEKIRSKKIQAELKVLRVNVQAGQEGLEAITSNIKAVEEEISRRAKKEEEELEKEIERDEFDTKMMMREGFLLNNELKTQVMTVRVRSRTGMIVGLKKNWIVL